MYPIPFYFGVPMNREMNKIRLSYAKTRKGRAKWADVMTPISMHQLWDEKATKKGKKRTNTHTAPREKPR